MKILGIDLGLARCGVAVVKKRELHSDKPHLVDSELITTPSGFSFQYRANSIEGAISDMVDEHDPGVILIESFHSLKSKSQKELIMLEGYLKMVYYQREEQFRVLSLVPSQVKKLVTGKGNAQKHVVRDHVFEGLDFGGFAGRRFSVDEVDAMAVCLAFLGGVWDDVGDVE